MASPRRPRTDRFYDSAFGLPDFEAQPAPPAPQDDDLRTSRDVDSSASIDAGDPIVAVSVEGDELRRELLVALHERRLTVGGADLLPQAGVIVSDVTRGVTPTMAHLRPIARPDAAILLVLEDASAPAVAEALLVGAYACLRLPVVPAELLSFVGLALDTRAAKVHAADLARKLDLESHLASIGRISAGLSHELGTPLTIALMNVESIRSECARLVQSLESLTRAPASELGDRLEKARADVESFSGPTGLQAVIEDSDEAISRAVALLRLMRELVGKRDAAPLKRVSLMGLVEQVLGWFKADLPGVVVDVMGVDVCAAADPTRLGQILQNFMANAIHAAKCLPAPRLRLHVYEDRDHAVVSVRDNGPGIPEELQDRLFEPFFTTRRGKGGTGLGLALCREYALQMGADLSFWSMPGRGACFRVHLPLRARGT